jgi:ABC-type antimicrobial peptide transport system permease subunit
VVALGIAVVGVAGVLAFSVSRRVREFGIRLAVGSQSRELVSRVVAQGAIMAAAGIAAGAVGGFVLARIAESYLAEAQFPDAGPLLASALVLLAAALVASAFPAARAARIDVMQALRSD